jgi:hypothetical protein
MVEPVGTFGFELQSLAPLWMLHSPIVAGDISAPVVDLPKIGKVGG